MAVALGMLYQLDSDYTHACGMPFRLDGPRFDTRPLVRAG